MAKNPKKRSKKSGKRKPAKHATPATNRNVNTVKVHVNLGGEAVTPPPPYSGPDRGYFAFNPVFDVGGSKQPLVPPMNTGVAISTGPVKRGTDTATQIEGEATSKSTDTATQIEGEAEIIDANRRARAAETGGPYRPSDGLTKKEIYRRLREHGLSGISQKSREELAVIYDERFT